MVKDLMPAENVVYSDRYDRRAFVFLKDKAQKISELEQKGLEKVKTFSPLLQDLYSILYKADPILKTRELVRPSERVNRMLVQKIMDTKQYPELREYTYLDEFGSTMGVLTLGEAVLELLPEEAKKQVNKMKEQEENLQNLANQAQVAQEAADETQGEADQLADAAAETKAKANTSGNPQTKTQAQELQAQADAAQSQADELGQQAGKAKMTFEQAQQKLEQEAEQLEKSLESKLGDELRRKIRNAVKEAAEKTQEQKELIEAWGVEAGEIQNLPYEEKMRLAEEIKQNKKLREVAKLVGRFRRMALSKQKEKTQSRAGVVTNVKRGNDLRRLVPSERAKLSHPILRQDFLRRWAQRQLFVFEVKEKKSLGQGPVIVCIDNSGSISAEQEIWEKALALGLYQASDYQNRHFVFIQYGGPSDPLVCVEIKKGKASYRKLIEVARYFLGGGTDFEKPLKKAREFIEKGMKADVVFITDGHCAVSQDFLTSFNQARKDVPFSVFSVLLTKGGSVSPAAVEKFSDEIFSVEQLTVESAGEIFGRI